MDEARRRLLKAVKKLKEPYREIILRRFYDEMTYQEIAKMDGKSTNTIRTQVRRGVKMVWNIMERDFEDDYKAWRFSNVDHEGWWFNRGYYKDWRF